MVLCDVCNHAIWKYPVWDCSRYFSIIMGNVRPVASGTSRDTADRCHRLRSHLQVVVELMICSEETCGPFLKSCQICIFGLSKKKKEESRSHSGPPPWKQNAPALYIIFQDPHAHQNQQESKRARDPRFIEDSLLFLWTVGRLPTWAWWHQ